MDELITRSNISPADYKTLYPLFVFDVSKPSIGSMVGRLVGATHQNCQKLVEKDVGQCQVEL